MDLWIGAVNLGILYAFMATGIFITFRILKFSDITVDGSFTTGAAVTAVLIMSGINPVLALGGGFLSGAIAGIFTGLIYTKLKIDGLLSGILVMIGLYSINLHIMGKSNIPLIDIPTFVTFLDKYNPSLPKELWLAITLIIISVFFWLFLTAFFRTDLGITIRASGDNPTMALASGVNVDIITILALSLANGLAGLSGGLIAQYQGFADIGMGIGTLMIGLASVIIGESIIKKSSLPFMILNAIIGSVVYRFMIALALYFGMNPIDLKLFTSIFVLITLYATMKVSSSGKKRGASLFSYIKIHKKTVIFGTTAAIIILISLISLHFNLFQKKSFYKIGVLQLSDNGLLNITRDSFSEEMKKLGYIDGKNCKIDLQNAQGDIPTVNTILDKFKMDKYDIVVAISTSVTQGAISKIKDIPVVFASVANPFILQAGKSDKEHLPNVTGVYGWDPMDKIITIVKTIHPGKIKIGAIWDPAMANSVFNTDNLRKAVSEYKDITFEGTTVTSSSEVYEGARALAGKNIDIYVLPTDNIVYSAFESIVKAGRDKKIPICLTDTARLKDGALFVYGFDYNVSGTQSAHLVDRILRGEKPADIPFEKYNKIEFGINLKTALDYNIKIPPDLLSKATIIVHENGQITYKDRVSESPKKLVIFRFNDSQLMIDAEIGFIDELGKRGILKDYNITIDKQCAQGDYANAQAIAQDIIQDKYDYIVTFSTPSLQVMANLNKNIPHIFGCVTDPYRMGVAKTSEDHQKNVTGVATFQPVVRTFEIMRQVFPDAKKIGILWNPSEACSQACTAKAREGAKKYGFELIEINVNSTGEIPDGLNTLIGKGIDIIFTSGDNTIGLSTASIAKTLSDKKIPYITNTASDVERGSFISVGADYSDVGKETALLTEKVIKGEKPENIPIDNYIPEKISINFKLAKEYGVEIPASLIKDAKKVAK